MTKIELSNKEIKKLRCLGNTLASNIIPVKEVREFLAGLEQKVDSPAWKNRSAQKNDRKYKYKLKLAS